MTAQTLYPVNPVLIVDDEAEVLRFTAMALRMGGINHILELGDSRDVAGLLARQPVHVMLLDLTMPFVTGEEILTMAGENHPEIPIIVITGMDDVEAAVRCMTKGALDYIVKPVGKTRLVSGVRRAIEIRELRDQTLFFRERILSGEPKFAEAFSHIITKNKAMLSIFQYAEAIATSRQPILITGETGVGKELMVKAVHALSAPKSPLVSVNVAGLDDNTFTDTLFGHIKGAFTGASERRQGLVEKAAGGILHLDEIGDLDSQSQIRLLRLLQEGEYYPLGSDTPRITNARVIATTNHDLSALQESGRFRKDLYYRLLSHQIHIPPLRRRRADIPLLINHFTGEAASGLNRKPPVCSEDTIALLTRYDFPGNVRELKTMVHDAVSRNRTGKLSHKDFGNRINKNDFRPDAGPSDTVADGSWWFDDDENHLPTMEEAIRLLIRKALARCDNNQSRAARALGISRQRLARHLKSSDS